MIKFAIVGCGHIAKKHAEAIEKAENAQLVAVCDKIPESMQYYKEKYDVKTFTDLSDLLKDENEVDVINICTPSGFHANIAIQAANAKKHVVVEKPISLTLEDADAIISACNENGVKLTVVHPNRFRPAIKELRAIMDAGKLGKLSHADATVRWNRNQAYYDQAPWRGTKNLDGGVLMNQAIHNLDLLVWLMGDVDQVYSMSATRLRNIEAEDVSVGVARFSNGALGIIEAATTIYPKNLEESISIFGETGSVKIGGVTASFVEHMDIESLTEEEISEIVERVKADPLGKPGHQCIIEDIVEAIKTDREPIVTGEDGKRALELVIKLYDSADSNEPVRFEKNVEVNS
ncbi:Gfo/Idh/MocA family protein [Metabacillus halosaccharovorans]|uniref:Gfo/Idh/MocA family oxidoreductase n=1 Tax=Metabacillus halosaccharovorans TaxID=930124 RepID=A0ABT3DDM3_9BACI|nr:Gfo/Idh/MocA family oxidoreductase [Metabacillus halosaccharovorans]MCV9884757.1 Gfo/Idh/MocA family oxidoreductase [Metabacillus halosaccharovorans]